MDKAEAQQKESPLNCLAGMHKTLKKILKEIERQEPTRINIMNRQELGELQSINTEAAQVKVEYELYRAAAEQTKSANEAKIAELNAALETLQNQIGDQADPAEVETTIAAIKATLAAMNVAVPDLNDSGEVVNG